MDSKTWKNCYYHMHSYRTMSDLQVLQGGHDAWRDEPGAVGVPNLIAAPYRPGEMPTVVIIKLSETARRSLAERARSTALPAELWLRIAVETERHVRKAITATRASRDQVVAAVGEFATAVEDRPVPLHGHRHRLYAREVQQAAAQRKPHAEVSYEIALRLPEELLVAWSSEATGESRGLDEWVSDLLATSFINSWEWEVAAAGTGRSLGELIYAGALGSTTGR
jgi:hypothetical protein